jgi:HlyD family secretion protein
MDPRQKRRLAGRIVTALVLAGVAVPIALGFVPKPVPVTLGRAEQRPLDVVVDGSGKTRLRARYAVSAPLFGNLTRITLRPGDTVDAGSCVARITPVASALLDPRSRAEASGRVAVAQANLARSDAVVKRAEATLTFAHDQATRLRSLLRAAGASQQAVDQAELELRVAEEDLRAARLGRSVAQNELAIAKSSVAEPGAGRPSGGAVDVLAPISGQVLRVLQESEGVVQAGSPLLELGSPHNLEVVVDQLTTDAVRVSPGAEATIDRWGGDHPLSARVRNVEPSAFTTHSALGVEEQRVWVVLDLLDPPEARPGLSDGYRVETHIRVLHRERALTVPTSAVFRSGGTTAVFEVEGGRARRTPVELGERTPDWAEVKSGLAAGSAVVLYPSDQVRDGVQVAEASAP